MPDDTSGRLIVYGHAYCTMASVLAKELQAHRIEYEWRDLIKGEPRYKEEVRALANGNLSVPTVIFPDGTVLVEPPVRLVLARMGVAEKVGWLRRWWQSVRNEST